MTQTQVVQTIATTGNPLLAPISDLIDYAAIKPEHIAPAIELLLAETRQGIEALVSTNTQPGWDNFIEPMEALSSRLWRAWSVAGHLNAVINTATLREAYNSMLPVITEFSTWIGLNRDLFERYLAVSQSAQFAEYTPTRKRIIELALRDFRLSGVELEGEKRQRYAQLNEDIALTSQKFSENALDAMDNWHYQVHDAAMLEGLPQDVIDAAAQAASEAATQSTEADDAAGSDSTDNALQPAQAGWRFTLKMPSYLPVMQYAKSATLREALYRGYATLASELGEPQYDNSPVIEKLLDLRLEDAHLLGFANFAQMRLQTRMAQSADQVIAFLRDLAAKARPFAQRDVTTLREFAASELGMTALEPWDYTYVSEQLRQARYAYSDEEVRQYLSEANVMKGLFGVIKTLFGIDLVPFEAPVWHSDVRVFEVQEQGRVIGHLYTDLYARKGKQSGAWVDSERSRHVTGTLSIMPVVYLNCNFSRPQGNKPALLTHDDVITLFHETGHALHALLSKVDEPAASPFASVEWDAIELPSQFMENFVWEWPVMRSMAMHWETGKQMDRDLFERLLSARNFQSGMQMVRQIEFSLFDMLIHTRTEPTTIDAVMQILNQVRQEVAVIMPPSWNRFAHNFSHLFAGGYGAGYYSYKWAEVLSADAYSLFEEHADGDRGTLNPQIGQLFKEQILAVGGSRPAAESFEAFRGRGPSPEALLRHSGLVADAAA
ncbi:oligopeptidase A [Advenella kashmirensis WT001]|uniref:oligopeptidase A n=1 Tax=Advenella kashmirensis (strain DSM 17095 / LMG 22695 / WT001) TaxID=1036672 RepID=I3UBW0_ADVKW|nr:M3 family metallopeptidase [Advenella kashmirensis]AFK62498.1 oligopeptidase A [Advenella kashmirensis WT001]